MRGSFGTYIHFCNVLERDARTLRAGKVLLTENNILISLFMLILTTMSILTLTSHETYYSIITSITNALQPTIRSCRLCKGSRSCASCARGSGENPLLGGATTACSIFSFPRLLCLRCNLRYYRRIQLYSLKLYSLIIEHSSINITVYMDITVIMRIMQESAHLWYMAKADAMG